MRNIHKSVMTLSLSCIVLANAAPQATAETKSAPPAKQAVQMIPASFADLAENLTDSVVNISTTQKMMVPQDFPDMPQFPEGSPFEDFFEEFMNRRDGGKSSVPATSLGSGFIIDAENGYIVTNNHVVKDAEEIRITLADDLTINAEIIGTDDKTDLALLQVDTKDIELKSVSFGDSDKLRVGDWTLAVGNPFGLGGSVTAGIVSARARDISTGPYDDYIQTDASINRGNSGGPLFNMSGKVIGINTAIFSPSGGSVGVGFSIPSAQAEPVINQIIKYGRTRRGWLGVRVQKVTKEIAESLDMAGTTHGALIASVNEKGPAITAGLKAGDIILEVGEQKLRQMKMLPRIVAEYDIGSEIEIKYWRDKKEHITKVKIGELEKAEDDGLLKTKPKSESTGVDVDIVGFTLKTMSDELRTEYGISNNVEGLVISKIAPMSEAEKKGLKEGSVIVEVNQQPVKNPQEVIDILEKAQKNNRKSVLLFINNAGNNHFTALRVPKGE